MKIILTGASGFLGKYISAYFSKDEVITIGRNTGNILAHLERDIPVLPKADLVVHAAGKAHIVPRTAEEAADFYSVNVVGTRNLLAALKNAPGLPEAFVFISSVAVYGLESGIMITEDTPLLAADPYGLSKIEAEKLVTDWCVSNSVPFTILRLPLIAGVKPPGNLKTMIDGIKRGFYVNIAGGKAKKSIVLAESVPPILLVAAQTGGIYNLTDGYHPSFAELSELMAVQLRKNRPISIPGLIAQSMAKAGDIIGEKSPLNTKKYKKMINDLTFDDSKARKLINWAPLKVLQHFKIK